MAESTHKVSLLPENRSVDVPAGTTLRQALAQLDVTVTAPCGGEGSCGKCRVELPAGGETVTPVTSTEQSLLTSDQVASGFRLSCQVQVYGNLQVRVPMTSKASEMRVIAGGLSRKVPAEPAVVKVAVEMPAQTLTEPYSRLEHLRRCGELRQDLKSELSLLRCLPGILDESAGHVTAVLLGDKLIEVETGDTSDRCFGVALDLGTTTVVATLLDLVSGREMGSASMVNRQTVYGHDVIGRINATLEEADGLEELRQAALESLNGVIDQVSARAGVQRAEIYVATVVGNATMMHLLLGISPASLGILPFIATVGDEIETPASEVGLELHPEAWVYLLPNIAGYVGADTVGVILASGLDEDDGRIRMVADIGTNCEIALRHGDRLLVTSTPAGPAFEGARITCGMYAAPGAIEKVQIDEDVNCKVIGGKMARGLCGSGLVDVAAELLRVGVIDETGRMLSQDEQEGRLPQFLHSRLKDQDGDLAFVLAGPETETPVTLTQRDFRELQLAKGAIRTGIDLLLEQAELTADDLDEFCVAGGFGSYLNKDNAVRLGLIPKLPAEKIRFIGNGALVGAKLALLSNTMRGRGTRVALQAEHLQIAGTPDFQMRFSEAMLFEI